jgi:hypothetical protein
MGALSGLQLCALAMLGEYVWRGLDQSRGRPIYVIEAMAGPTGSIDARSSARF